MEKQGIGKIALLLAITGGDDEKGTGRIQYLCRR
jgi:hypothetical protein